MFVKPLDGLTVRDPRSRVPLPADGVEVPETSFWLRRLRDKSIAIAEPAAAAAADTAATPAQPAAAEAPAVSPAEHEEH